MKKVFLFFGMMLLCGAYAMAASTTDHYVVSCGEVLLPGEDGEEPYVRLSVALSGSNIYTLYQLDIQFPEGVDPYEKDGDYWVVMDKSSGIYPFTMKAGENTYTHSLQCNYGTIDGKQRCLRIVCTSSLIENFKQTSGNLFYLYIKASTFAKPGNLNLRFTGQAFGKKEASTIVKYTPSDFTDTTVEISTTAKAKVTVSSANKWSTCILPFDATIPTGVKAYSTNSTTTIEGSKYLVLTSVASLRAYTPYILRSESGYNGTLTGTVDASKYPASGFVTGGFLNGAIIPQQKSVGYVLQNLSEGVKFYNMNNEVFAIPAGKCWVTLPAGEVKAIGFPNEDESSVQDIATPMQQDVLYTVDGRREENPKVGQIYVANGKKVLKIK